MNKPNYFNQNDYPGIPYPSTTHPNATIKSGGCGVVCYAMVHSELLDPTYNPIKASQDSISGGYRAPEGTDDAFYPAMAKKYNIPFAETKCLDVAIQALKDGKLVVCRMKDWFKVGAGHFILAYAIDGTQISINDPASRSNSQKKFSQEIFRVECIGYFIFSKPVIEKPMTYWDALQIIDKAIGIDEKYWDKRYNIDPYFDNLIIKFATYLKGECK